MVIILEKCARINLKGATWQATVRKQRNCLSQFLFCGMREEIQLNRTLPCSLCTTTWRSSFLVFQTETFNTRSRFSFSALMLRQLPAFSCGSLASALENDIEIVELPSSRVQKTARGAIIAGVSSIGVSMSPQDTSVSHILLL